MNIKKNIQEINSISIGFERKKAEEKINKTIFIIDEIILNYDIYEKIDIQNFLETTYGTIYELENSRQMLDLEKEIMLCEKTAQLARKLFGKSKELLPYLNLILNNSIGNNAKYIGIQKEITEIENSDIS